MGATDIDEECATPSSLLSYGGEESTARDTSFGSISFEVESGPPHHDNADETMKKLELIKKCLLSKKVQKDMHGLHDILHVVHTYVTLLTREVSTLREEVARQKQAAEIAVMEKECELRMVQSEAAALKVETSSRAAVASVLERKVTQLQNELQKSQSTLDSAVSNSQTQQEQSVLHIEELETSVQKLTAELRETKDSLALASEVNNETSNALELTRKDAASAAAELMVACEENKRLERQCDDLKEDVERAESAQAEIEQRNSYLEGQMRHLEAENNALREELYQMHLSNHETNPLPALPTPTTQSRGSGSIVAPVTPGQDGPMDPEDLLAMEISLLRHQKAGLEDQVKSAQILTPMAASLHREAMGLRADNALLKERAEIAELEAHSARDELLRVKQQANELHSELAKVLKGLGLQQPPKTSEQAKDDGLNARFSPITTLHGVASYQNPTFVEEDSAKLPLCKAQDDQQVDSPHSSGSSENALLTELRSALNSLNPTTN